MGLDSVPPMSKFIDASRSTGGMPVSLQKERSDMAMKSLNSLAASAFELDMRVPFPSDDIVSLATRQQVDLEKLRHAVATSSLSHDELNVRVVAQMKTLAERLETFATLVATDCSLKLHCECQMPMRLPYQDPAVPFMDATDVIRQKSVLDYVNTHLAFMFGGRTSDLNPEHEAAGVRSAWDELSDLFKESFARAPRTVEGFMKEWAGLWSSDKFMGDLHLELRWMKRDAYDLAADKFHREPAPRSRFRKLLKRAGTKLTLERDIN
ncbi:uncharacterized protein DNG_08225 [Cephalotrichum gorgonifer]|uniref:Uncharacterized protein n=1 Tax=Cephalotrichum gorgonifer TaxID=2041049 RepID=A0AAE8N597_9PEZI|nr:uncharacterized protein DNG_08225 [Cephalotrichum gorgonifer]